MSKDSQSAASSISAMPSPYVPHDHREYVDGCFRCDLSRAEVAASQPPDLTDFLLARIAEELAQVDEAAAMYPHTADESHWHADLDEVHVGMGLGRARAECEAKRRIAERHRPWDLGSCSGCGGTASDFPNRHAQCPDVLALAAIYADHEDYRQEWRL